MGGGNNGKKTIFSAEGLSRADVLAIGRSRCKSDGDQYPGIAVDINWAVYQLMKLSTGPLVSVCQLLLTWASEGAIVMPICDGDTRPVSKQATNRNAARRKKGHNKAQIARVDLRKVNEALSLGGGLDEEARRKAIEQRTTLQKDIKAGESQSTKQVPNNFPHLLAEKLAELSAHQLNENNGTVKEVLTAEFQADGLMGGLYEEGKVQLIMTGDIDIPIIFGDRCISITKCTGKTFNLASTCKKTLTDAVSCLPQPRQQKIKICDPKFPIYSGIIDRRLRVLMMVIVESDVCPGGVYGAGPEWVQNAMKAIRESDNPKSVYEQLIDCATAKDKRFTAELLNVYVDAVVYEPVNESGGERKYMDGHPPVNLPSYLEEFQSSSTKIDAGPVVLECKCTGEDARHKFLEAVGHHSCTACKEIICKHCTDFIEKQPHCLECYLVKKILPGVDLLAHRRNELQEDADVYAAKMLEIQPKWASLMEETKSRSKRVATTSLSNLTQHCESTVTPLRRSGRISSMAEEEEQPMKKKKKKKKNSGSTPCAKIGCNNNSHMKGINMHRIPPMPKPLETSSTGKKKTKEQIIKWRRKAEIHLEFMDRCGYGRDGTITKKLRICSAHETVKHTTRQIKFTHDGITISEKFCFDVISGAGESSSLIPSTATKGVATTRAISRMLNNVQEKAKKAPSPVTVPPATENKLQRERRLREEAEGTAAETVMAMQQVVECNSIEKSPVPINPVVARIAGINTPPPKVPPRKRKFKTHDTALDKSQEKLMRTADLPPTVLPNMKASEVKRRTGFDNVSAMLAYIVVVTNGNFDLIRERRSSLTWFEEWFRYFEWCYGEVCRRQIDRESEWGIVARQVRDVIDLKASIEVGALQSWPRFASFSEDKAIRDSVKWSKYDNDRIILWDMTNVTMPQCSDAGVQRTTFSQYYGENCLKAGVGIQLCGWLLVWDLWGGAITDDRYNNRSGYLQKQKEFAKTDLVDGKVLPFTNVKDRGYRTSFAAWKHGEQKVLQPPFAKSDKRFNGRQTIYAGSIARDRSGNERGVNVSKRSGMFQRGFQNNMSQIRFNNAWLTWSFKANFMYKRVL